MFSRADFLRAALCWLLLIAPIKSCLALELELSLGKLDHPAFSASGVTLHIDLARQGEAEIRFERLQVADAEYRGLRLICSGFQYDGRRLECPEGKLLRVDDRGRDRPPLPFSLSWRKDGYLDFSLRDIDTVALSPLVKRLRRWNPQGRINLHLQVNKDIARLELTTQQLAFTSREGDVTGRDLAFALMADARKIGETWRWQARLDWTGGELSLPPWKRDARMQVDATGSLTPDILEVESARLAVADIGTVTASLRWDRERGIAKEWGLVSERIDLAAAMREWLQPWLATLGFPAWQASGDVLFAAEWREGELQRFYAGLEHATLADATGYLELAGLDARIPWEAGQTTEAEISAASGRFGDLPLGGFSIPMKLEGATARIDNLKAPLLDGHFEVENLLLQKVVGVVGAQWRAEFSGGINGVSMPKLSRALKLPVMTGKLSARVPRIAYEDDILRMDGALGIEVFDGGMIVHQLRMLHPFSPQRHLLVDVTARDLDLGMLTRTFAFGSIAGRFDADLHDLEMEGWQPLRFDARIDSSPGEYPRILSLGALKDITALGEPSEEEKAIRHLPERSSIGLGYARIGLGCTLRDGVCDLTGIPGKDEADRILIMQGSGIPSIDIIGYNRRMDWKALVARFREILAGREGLVIE